jgi:H+-transporting ATP synthase F0 complex subunit s
VIYVFLCYFFKRRFDEERAKEIGPNLACAEWLMKNGAKVRCKGCREFVSHYDCLPTRYDVLGQFKIEQVYAGEEASISHIGFTHFSVYTLIQQF